MPYEVGMSVEYDALNGTVTIYFRGKKTILPSKYTSRDEAIKAGEKYCKNMGWVA